jgi:CheY-like chemotaxis protein
METTDVGRDLRRGLRVGVEWRGTTGCWDAQMSLNPGRALPGSGRRDWALCSYGLPRHRQRKYRCRGGRLGRREAGAYSLRYVANEHVAVVDVRMPSMDGLELAEKLRASLPDLPIVFMTGFADDRLEHLSRLADREPLTKPFRPSCLVDILRTPLHEK